MLESIKIYRFSEKLILTQISGNFVKIWTSWYTLLSSSYNYFVASRNSSKTKKAVDLVPLKNLRRQISRCA